MKKISHILIILAAIGVSGYASTYLNLDIKGLLSLKGEILNNSVYRIIFYLHVSFGMIALTSGAWQFIPQLRQHKIQWHKTLGKVYFYTVMISSSAGLIIAMFAAGGWIAKTGFSLFSIYWAVTAVLGVMSIKNGNIQSHFAWMHRSYAAAFAAVTLRIWLLIFPYFQLEFIVAYQIASWMSWIVNIIIAEIIINHSLKKNVQSLTIT